MVIIELVGPSCAGKSTLMQRLELEMRHRGQVVRSLNARHSAVMYDLLRAVRDPGLRKWCMLNPLLAVGSKIRLVLKAVGLVERTRRQDGILLLDEGPVRLFLRLHSKKSRCSALLTSRIPKPDLLVLVTCDPVVRLARLRQADRRRARTLSNEVILGRGREDAFVHQFAADHDVPVMEVDTSPGSNDPETLAVRLQSWCARQPRQAEERLAADLA